MRNQSFPMGRYSDTQKIQTQKRFKTTPSLKKLLKKLLKTQTNDITKHMISRPTLCSLWSASLLYGMMVTWCLTASPKELEAIRERYAHTPLPEQELAQRPEDRSSKVWTPFLNLTGHFHLVLWGVSVSNSKGQIYNHVVSMHIATDSWYYSWHVIIGPSVWSLQNTTWSQFDFVWSLLSLQKSFLAVQEIRQQ